MVVTVNTDASFHRKHKVGGYAFWIICDAGRWQMSGPLAGEINQPDDAELRCIVNAMVFISLLVQRGLCPWVSRIIVNTDSLNSIYLLKNDVEKIKRYNITNKCFKTPMAKFYATKRRAFADTLFDYRHVRAHQAIESKRQYINDWCDKEAKKHVKLIVSQILENQTKDNVKNADNRQCGQRRHNPSSTKRRQRY